MRYAIFDLETTGFDPRRDRILEIAIVILNESGQAISEYSTLINPMQDIGNSSIHGVQAKHVVEAPRFEEVAGTLIDLFREADVLVAHNFQFDWNFLCAELERVNYLPPRLPASICMIAASQSLFANSPRGLMALCAELSIPLEAHHTALSDARATAALLRSCLSVKPIVKTGACLWDDHAFVRGVEGFARSHRSDDGRAAPVLERLVGQLPSHPGEAALDAYFDLLDRVFADSILEDEEAQALLDLAVQLGLSRDQVQSAHETYFQELVSIAVSDRYISEMEREHLSAVGKSLGLDRP